MATVALRNRHEDALSAEGIVAAYGGHIVLEGIDLTLASGDCVALVGPNGAGKSTLLRILAGAQDAASGSVRLAGTALSSLPPRRRAQRVGLSSQTPKLAFPTTALGVVLLGRHPHTGFGGFVGSSDVEIARDALREVGLDGAEDRLMRELSGGEQQRAHVARALAQETEILLLDEPTSAQDFRGIGLILRAVRRRAERGVAALCAVHDLNQAARFFDRVILLSDRAIRADGPPRETLRSPALARAYSDAVRIVETDEGIVALPE